jgi:hypothetical protein
MSFIIITPKNAMPLASHMNRSQRFFLCSYIVLLFARLVNLSRFIETTVLSCIRSPSIDLTVANPLLIRPVINPLTLLSKQT